MKNQPVKHNDVAINENLLTQLAYNEKMAELGKISAGVVKYCLALTQKDRSP